ncbi:hypothetical protein Tco_0785934 [Tanacetum coccineum]
MLILLATNEVNAVSGKNKHRTSIRSKEAWLCKMISFLTSQEMMKMRRRADYYTNKKDIKEFGGTWEEPKKVIHALKDPSWIEAMQEELLQFKLQEVWTLVDLPNGKRAIGSK